MIDDEAVSAFYEKMNLDRSLCSCFEIVYARNDFGDYLVSLARVGECIIFSDIIQSIVLSGARVFLDSDNTLVVFWGEHDV